MDQTEEPTTSSADVESPLLYEKANNRMGKYGGKNSEVWDQIRKPSAEDILLYLIPLVLFIINLVLAAFRSVKYFRDGNYVYFALTISFWISISYFCNILYCESENWFKNDKLNSSWCSRNIGRLIGLCLPVVQIWRFVPNWLKRNEYKRAIKNNKDFKQSFVWTKLRKMEQIKTEFNAALENRRLNLREIQFSLVETFIEGIPQNLLSIHLAISQYAGPSQKHWVLQIVDVLGTFVIPWVAACYALTAYDKQCRDYLQVLHFSQDKNHTVEWKLEKESFGNWLLKFIFHLMVIGSRVFVVITLSLKFSYGVFLIVFMLFVLNCFWVQIGQKTRPKFENPLWQKSTLFTVISHRLINTFAFHMVEKSTKNVVAFHGIFAIVYLVAVYFGEIFPSISVFKGIERVEAYPGFFANSWIPLLVLLWTFLFSVLLAHLDIFNKAKPSIPPLEVLSAYRPHFKQLEKKGESYDRNALRITLTAFLSPYEDIRTNNFLFPFLCTATTTRFQRTIDHLWAKHVLKSIDCYDQPRASDIEEIIDQVEAAEVKNGKIPITDLVYDHETSGIVKNIVYFIKRRFEAEPNEETHHDFHMAAHLYLLLPRLLHVEHDRFTTHSLRKINMSLKNERGFLEKLTCI